MLHKSYDRYSLYINIQIHNILYLHNNNNVGQANTNTNKQNIENIE
jgi:hypothetical protein